MRILFVSRQKQNGNISPVIDAQADSLKDLTELSVYSISGKGWKAYLKGISGLRKHLRTNDVDIVHAHYSYVGMVAGLATKKPVVVSLMGSDIEDLRFGRVLIRLFAKLKWKAIIVKSERSQKRIRLKKAQVIPNGVDLDVFKPIPNNESRAKLGLKENVKYVLFLSNPIRKEKNFKLAAEGCELVADGCRLGAGSWSVELLALHDISHGEVPLYLSAVDVLLLTSFFEGSPNAVKEAMACNCPIVSTDVGDVRNVIGNTQGCFITTFEPENVASKLRQALDFGKRTNGRERIKHLDIKTIAEDLEKLYKSIII